MSRPPSLNPSSLPFFPSSHPPPLSDNLYPPFPLPQTPTTTRAAHRLSGSSATSFDDHRAKPTVVGSPSNFARSSLGAIGDSRDHNALGGVSLTPSTSLDHPMNGHAHSRPKYTSSLSDTSTSASPPLPTAPLTQADFDAHLRASPLLTDILDRIVLSERTSLALQRELGEINRKLGLLLSSSAHYQQQQQQQEAGEAQGEDVKQLEQRLNTLTTSVGQLLALQSKAHFQSVNASFSPSSPAPSPSTGGPPRLGLISDTPQAPPQTPNTGVGVPFRGDVRPSPSPVAHPRPAGSPLRQWSQGPLDFSTLPRDSNLVRQEAVLRGSAGGGVTMGAGIGPVGVGGGAEAKRRPGGMIRRESSNSVVDSEWGGGSPREAGPNVTKWEQLPLSLELQHAIVKYGVGPPNKIQQRAVPFLLRGSDIIAQAPPTQERIAAYVIPAIQLALNALSPPRSHHPLRGPVALLISTTVDQANQAHKMLRDLGGPIGLRVALCAGGGQDVAGDLRAFAHTMPHVLCGTPQRVNALFMGGLNGAEVRFVVLDEVDQLIARNLHEHVFSLVRMLPAARRGAGVPAGGTPSVSPVAAMTPVHNPFDTPFPSSPFQPGAPSSGAPNGVVGGNRRFPPVLPSPGLETIPGVERQTALFSNTVPQDVLNLANAIQMREAVRVLVRRDGGGGATGGGGPGGGGGGMSNGSGNGQHGADQGPAAMRGLRNYYLYLAFTAGGRVEPAPQTPGGGLGIIGSGRVSVAVSNAETETARGWKLDALAELLEDAREAGVGQAIVYVGGMIALEAVGFRLVGKGMEVVAVHGDMVPGARMAAFNKFRNGAGGPRQQQQGQVGTKVLVVYDVPIKAPDVYQVPLVINYDLPKAVEEYAHRVSPAMPNNHSRAGVVVNFVTATGGDVEMLRSIECFYKIKCPEVPSSLRDVL